VSEASIPLLPTSVATADAPDDAAVQIRRLVDAHHAFVWRSVRRLGIDEGDVDDVVQKVFLVASRRVAEIEEPAQRRFLFATAMRLAANQRRAVARRRRDAGELEDIVDPGPSPEKTAGDRVLLDALLSVLPIELRCVFVLFELEKMTSDEIARLLVLPVGTVASRLRRARELVEAKITRMRAEAKRGLA
jgi:RNA polymerase sigma-70 factor (ECF subfamily)